MASSTGDRKLMDPIEARNEVRSLYALTKTLVGAGWTEDTRMWGQCTTANGASGVNYNLFAYRLGASQGEPAGVAEQARERWADNGHRVEIVVDDRKSSERYILSDPPWLTGSSPAIPLVQFSVGEKYADFSATSRCVIGDLEEQE